MSRENYFNRMMPRRSLGGFRSSLTSLSNDRRTYISPSRKYVRICFFFFFYFRSTIALFSLFSWGICRWNLALLQACVSICSWNWRRSLFPHLKFISLSFLSFCF